MDGVTLTPLKIIDHPKGDVLHGLKSSSPGFSGFGEAYFSVIKPHEIKGWKRHRKMVLNLIVPVGEVLFVVYDDRPGSSTAGQYEEVVISRDHYCRLTVDPGLWVAFKGMAEKESLVLNLASIEHNPDESERRDLNEVNYVWQMKNRRF